MTTFVKGDLVGLTKTPAMPHRPTGFWPKKGDVFIVESISLGTTGSGKATSWVKLVGAPTGMNSKYLRKIVRDLNKLFDVNKVPELT